MSLWHSMRFFFLVTGLAPLAGCGALGGGSANKVALEQIAATSPHAPAARAWSPGTALARLPVEAGSVLAVREARRPFALSQEIDLGNGAGTLPWRNAITIALFKGNPGLPTAAWPGRPSASGIATELTARFPGLTMTIATTPGRNAHGAYGRAVGRRADGLRCFYGWQWIDETARDQGRPQQASLRVALCSYQYTLDQLSAMMDQLTLETLHPIALEADYASTVRAPQSPSPPRAPALQRSSTQKPEPQPAITTSPPREIATSSLQPRFLGSAPQTAPDNRRPPISITQRTPVDSIYGADNNLARAPAPEPVPQLSLVPLHSDRRVQP